MDDSVGQTAFRTRQDETNRSKLSHKYSILQIFSVYDVGFPFGDAICNVTVLWSFLKRHRDACDVVEVLLPFTVAQQLSLEKKDLCLEAWKDNSPMLQCKLIQHVSYGTG